MSTRFPQVLPDSNLGIGAIGTMVGGGIVMSALLVAALSVDLEQPQITTVTVGGATNSSVYSIQAVDSVGTVAVASYESDGSASIAEIAAGLLAAAKANPVFGAIAEVSGTTSTVVLSGRIGGASQTFTVTFPDNPSTQLTQAATQAAADAPTYTIGRFVELEGAVGNNLAVGLVDAATAAAIAYTVTHGAGATYSGSFTVPSPTTGSQLGIEWSAAAGGSAAATYAAISTAISTALTTAGIVGATLSTVSNVVTATFPGGWGAPLPLSTSASGGGDSPAMTAAVTQPSAAAEYVLVRQSADWAPYRGQDPLAIVPQDGRAIPIPIVRRGLSSSWRVEIASSETPTVGAQVYVETAAGATRGRATGTASPTTAPLPGVFFAPGCSAGIAIITIP